ncbi:lantibiotic dehydratase [Streptomyces albidoflavus]|uniref:lantibiotic dehydratase n=1 Tax=Streptomyces albidoflavus TaxID=1886 RepID=UPI000A1CA823|nr:lantibiotic dehydratase [Streptomyces albidoflavus]
MNSRYEVLYQCADAALVRAARYTQLPLPPWPDVIGDSADQLQQWQTWLRAVWVLDGVSEAVELASPALARHLRELSTASTGVQARQVRRTLISMIRYVQRLTGRSTPNGLFAGVAAATFGGQLEAHWGQWHRAVARADAGWITAVIRRLEACPELLRRLPVVASNTLFVRGDRLIVPYPAQSGSAGRPTAEVSLRFTSAVRATLDAARSPIPHDLLVDKVRAEFPKAPEQRVRDLVTSLIGNGALVSSLHAPSTVLDPLDHLVRQLDDVDAGELLAVAELLTDLRATRDALTQHNQALTPTDGRRLRRALHRKMTAVAAADHPLAVDLRVDCSLTLPSQVAREAERAATVLARLTPAPFGTPGWKDYHTRFFERYGIGSLVPVRDVTDSDVGLGFPAGYMDSDPETRDALTDRERRLLALAQAAALDGRDEICLDEKLIAALQVGDQDSMQVPPHMEISFRIEAASADALNRGDFTLCAIRPSRAIGTTTGRFLGLLGPEDRAKTAALLEQLPVNAPGALPVQLSFDPLNRENANVTRVPEVLPAVISIGEHRTADERTIDLDDLAVGCDRRRLYLVSLSRKSLVEPHVVHALDLRAHTPPMARFLAEISRSQAAVVTDFAWGAAVTLPYLPRVRCGRAVLAPARWLLHTTDLPDARASWDEWHAAVDRWRTQRRVPAAVALTEGDQALPLDLSESAHRAVLRTHLATAETAVLTETPSNGGGWWFDGRAHEIVASMTATRPPTWPTVAPVTADRVLTRDHGHLPGSRPWLLAKLYGHHERQAEVLSQHLPDLLAQWETPPTWWFMRYRDPRPHLRLRIAVPEPTDVGQVIAQISDWSARLRRAGLLNDMQFATTYPETGRWGTGPLMALAEDVFAADSRALVVQFAQADRPHARVMATANFVSLATAFTGSVSEAMAWLTTYGKITDPRPLDRQVLAQAVRLADPTDDWAALRDHAGGPAITAAWVERDQVISRYRSRLHESDLDPHLVLDSLLHAHHIRAVGIDKDDERICVRLARAAALAWTARRENHDGTA